MAQLGQISSSQNRREWDKEKQHTEGLGPLFLEVGLGSRIKRQSKRGHAVWEASAFLVLEELNIPALGRWPVQVSGLTVP